MDIFSEKKITPMLIENKNYEPFDSLKYIYELKLDGIRALAYIDENRVELRNKRNISINNVYPELANINLQVKQKCIIDGEIIILKDNKPSFFDIQKRTKMTNKYKIELSSKRLPVCFVAFDILYFNNEDISKLPLLERKSILNEMITESPRLAISRVIKEKGVELYKASESFGLEGVVAKRADSKYYFGKRTKDWYKFKTILDDDFVICGYELKDMGISIILGAYKNNKIIYQSKVSLGISKSDMQMIMNQKKAQKEIYYYEFPNIDGTWIIPRLVCTVKYMEKTPNGGLRQPIFKAIREDKIPFECIVKDGDDE